MDKKAVFLLPTRALVNEKYLDFTSTYKTQNGIRIIRCTGEYSDERASFCRSKYDLALLTFEMFLNLIISTPNTLNKMGLIIIDEVHCVTDPTRGINLELLLTYLLSAKQRGISPQIIALSAVIGDINKFDAWLGLKLLLSNKRPVPLTEGVVDRSGQYLYRDTNAGSTKELQLIPAYAIQQRGKEQSPQDIIVPLVSKLIKDGEKVLIFRNTRGKAEGCANYLADELALPPANDIIQRLPNFDPSSTFQMLKNCLAGGTAFHTSNLSREEREAVEDSFRKPDGPIKVLVATTTVAAGINTPAYRNMAGRAGRFGFNETGKSILIANNMLQKNRLFQKYVMGQVENMSSSFDPRDIDTWILRLLAQVRTVARKDITTLLANTYGGYLATLSDSSWPQRMESQISDLVARMLALDLLEQEGEEVYLTSLGQACGNSSLSFRSSLRLVELIKGLSLNTLNEITLIAVVQTLQECDSVYTPLFTKGTGEHECITKAVMRYGSQTVKTLERFADKFVYQKRCKRAAILYDWIQGIPIDNIEKEFSYGQYSRAIQAGDIRRFAESTRFHLRSAFQIAAIISPQNIYSSEAFELLLRQLEVGLHQKGLDLLQLPVSLNRGECLNLLSKQIHNINELWKLSKNELISYLGEAKATQLEEIRPNQLQYLEA